MFKNYATHLRSEFDIQMYFRLQFFVERRVMCLTPYRRVMMFKFRYYFQHRSGGKSSALDRHSLNVSFDAIHDSGSRTICPSDL